MAVCDESPYPQFLSHCCHIAVTLLDVTSHYYHTTIILLSHYSHLAVTFLLPRLLIPSFTLASFFHSTISLKMSLVFLKMSLVFWKNWHTIKEGSHFIAQSCDRCDSKKHKTPVYIRARERERHFKICWFTTFLSCFLGVEDKQCSFVFIPSMKLRKTSDVFQIFSDVLWKTSEIFPKTWEVFRRISDIFAPFSKVWQPVWFKKWSVVALWRLNEALRSLSKGL